jgi:hypothetical protein
MNPLHDQRQGARSRRAWTLLALGAVFGALSVAVPTALAIHQFTDVPDSNPFHGDIAAIRGAGITSGKTCVPPGSGPTFCPQEKVTREAMAAFLHRGLSRIGFDSGQYMPVYGQVELAVVTVDVGGVPGETQFVKLDGVVSICGPCWPASNVCPCQTVFSISQDGVGSISSPGYITSQEGDYRSGSVTTGISVPSGTTQTFRLYATQGTNPNHYVRGTLSLITSPFGGSGGSTLGTEG